MTAHREPQAPSFWDDKPVLLITALAAVSIAVAGVWLLAATGSTLAMLLPVLAAIGGTALLFHVINKQMDSDDNQ